VPHAVLGMDSGDTLEQWALVFKSFASLLEKHCANFSAGTTAASSQEEEAAPNKEQWTFRKYRSALAAEFETGIIDSLQAILEVVLQIASFAPGGTRLELDPFSSLPRLSKFTHLSAVRAWSMSIHAISNRVATLQKSLQQMMHATKQAEISATADGTRLLANRDSMRLPLLDGANDEKGSILKRSFNTLRQRSMTSIDSSQPPNSAHWHLQQLTRSNDKLYQALRQRTEYQRQIALCKRKALDGVLRQCEASMEVLNALSACLPTDILGIHGSNSDEEFADAVTHVDRTPARGSQRIFISHGSPQLDRTALLHGYISRTATPGTTTASSSDDWKEICAISQTPETTPQKRTRKFQAQARRRLEWQRSRITMLLQAEGREISKNAISANMLAWKLRDYLRTRSTTQLHQHCFTAKNIIDALIFMGYVENRDDACRKALDLLVHGCVLLVGASVASAASPTKVSPSGRRCSRGTAIVRAVASIATASGTAVFEDDFKFYTFREYPRKRWTLKEEKRIVDICTDLDAAHFVPLEYLDRTISAATKFTRERTFANQKINVLMGCLSDSLEAESELSEQIKVRSLLRVLLNSCEKRLI